MSHHRIGLVVPSSNVTVETEIPALLARHRDATFSFHGSRMRMHTVSPEELAAMTEEMLEVLHRHADSAIRSREGLEKEPSGRSAQTDERRVRVFLHSFSLPTSG